jgi:hypothetical protein
MRLRAQVLKDLRPDGDPYPITEGDTVTVACHAANVLSDTNVTTVNRTCMQYVGAFKFDSLYAFTWAHERCHMVLAVQEFNSLPDGRTRMESLVRQDTTRLKLDINFGANSLDAINTAVADSTDKIDTKGPSPFTFWSRNATNSAWFLRTYPPNGILPPGC